VSEDKDLLERVSTLEEQVRGIAEVKSKIDVLYNLLMEMKLEGARSKSEFAMKADCTVCRKDVDDEIKKLQAGKQKILWTLLTTGSVFTIWLLEQMLHITFKIG